MNLHDRIERMQEAAKIHRIDKNPQELSPYARIKLNHAISTTNQVQDINNEQLLKSLPDIFKNKNFEDFKVDYQEQMAVKNIVMRYASTLVERQKRGEGLFLSGQTGTGKTLLLSILAKEIIRQGITVNYQSSLQFLRLFRDKNFESFAAFENLLSFYKSQKFLIIDEITEGRVNGGQLASWEKEMLFALIDMRIQNTLPTLIASNQDKVTLTERVGERTAERLLAKNIILSFTWASYRVNNKKK